jgi:predicted aspartyl protease
MGTFFHAITITGPAGAETLEALVDTGASFTTAPASLLERLGVTPHRTIRLTIASGEVVEWPWAWVTAQIDGVEEQTPCIFGAETAPPVIGAVTMEIMGLGVDPRGHRLVPREGFLMAISRILTGQSVGALFNGH